jgi:hypothetical protein
MNELDFRSQLEALAVNDDVNYDNYATQFVSSLNDLPGGDEPIYWHGRLIGLATGNERALIKYKIKFLGRVFSESVFRKRLETTAINLTEFKIRDGQTLVYQSDNTVPSPPNIDPRVVTYEAEFKLDGNPQVYRVRITHRLRRTYIAYDTEVTQM